MRRREFVSGAATLSFGLAAGSKRPLATPRLLPGSKEDRALAVADRFLQAYPSRGSLAAIGDIVQKDVAAPHVDCPDCLLQAVDGLLSHLNWRDEELLQITNAVIRRRIDEETAKDFKHGRIVRIRGWLLGETEVRLCGVAALRAA